jgi:signal transduction histidine kinase
MLILGVLVYINDKSSITNKTFFLFALAAVIYSIINFLTSQVRSETSVLWLLRLVIFSATWYSFFLFQFFYVFPNKIFRFSPFYKYVLLPTVSIVSILTLSPLMFSGLATLPSRGEIPKTIVEKGTLFFVGLVLFLVGSGVYFLIKKTASANSEEKRQYRFILLGTIITFTCIIVFNLILPALYLDVRFIPLAPIFTLPFIIFTAYAIIKHHLFNVRVVATELFIFTLWLTLLIITVRVSNLSDMILHAVVFMATVVLGIFLIRSVLQEVKMREKMSKLAIDLEITNKELKTLDEAKSDFISIASHQLRTPLSIIKGYMSMIREGTYGPVDEKLNDPIHKIYVSNERLINLVSDLLDLSRMERGKMQYEFVPVRLGEVAEGLVLDFEKVATDKGLKFNWLKVKGSDLVKGDANKLRQIVLNLIDNAIKYTSAGSLTIGIEEVAGRHVRFYVSDTGPGLTPEEVHALFQKFSRGQSEKTVHTEGLGLGLYVAKLIAQAHGGDLAVTSPGKGKGSTFSLTLPLYSEATENFTKFTSEI